jgi:hypothetical protein
MTLLLDLLAIHRLTRLVTRDHLTEPIRDRLHTEISIAATSGLLSAATADRLRYLLGCDWCMSIWVGVVAVTLRAVMPTPWRTLSFILAASTVTGFIATYE